MKRIIPIAVVIAIVLSIIVFHKNNINKFPSNIHAWSQSDRYALALGFINNDFDFFHPQTYNLTDFPTKNPTPKSTSITAVDFPINDFAVAVLMKIFHTTEPWCFRIYMLIYSLIGMFFLFLLSKQILKSSSLSLFVVLFCLTSPVYLYYQIGFLPTIPAISNLFIGLFLLFKNLDSKKVWQYSLGVFFITIAVLSRKPFIVFLIAIILYELWCLAKTKRLKRIETIVLTASTLVILIYFFYNKFLEQKYGTAFLNFILPPDNFGDSIEITKTVLKTWFFQYFTIIHYTVLVALLIVSTGFACKKQSTLTSTGKVLLAVILFTFIGFILYYVVMMKQFPDHDYYFLDSFYSVFCLLLIFLLSRIPFEQKKVDRLAKIGILIFIISLFTLNRITENKREETGFWDRIDITTKNFEGAETLLSENNIPTTAKILVLDSYTTNIPFIEMKRVGYAMMSQNPEHIKRALTWNYDYIVLQDCYTITDIVRSYPPIMNEIVRIAGNGKISIYKKQKSSGKIDAFTFLQLDTKKPIFETSIDFDSTPDIYWQKIYSKAISESRFNKSGIVNDSITYGATFSLKNSALLVQQPHVLYLTLDVFSQEKLDNSRIAVSIDENGQQQYFNAFELGDLVDTLSEWKHLQVVFPVLPPLKSEKNELKLFLWNDGKHLFYYDNVHVTVY